MQTNTKQGGNWKQILILVIISLPKYNHGMGGANGKRKGPKYFPNQENQQSQQISSMFWPLGFINRIFHSKCIQDGSERNWEGIQVGPKYFPNQENQDSQLGSAKSPRFSSFQLPTGRSTVL